MITSFVAIDLDNTYGNSEAPSPLGGVTRWLREVRELYSRNRRDSESRQYLVPTINLIIIWQAILQSKSSVLIG